jgi:hypothetical protein
VEQIESKLLHFIFGVAELILTLMAVLMVRLAIISLAPCVSLSFFLRGGERVVNHATEGQKNSGDAWI